MRSCTTGSGERDWTPTSARTAVDYRLAFGQGVLDLTRIGSLPGPQTVHITMAAGQVQIILPSTVNATVNANVHIGVVEVDGQDNSDTGYRSHGMNVNRTILPPPPRPGADHDRRAPGRRQHLDRSPQLTRR